MSYISPEIIIIQMDADTNTDIPDPPELTEVQIQRLIEDEKRNRLASHICTIFNNTDLSRLAQVGSFLIRGVDPDWDSKTYIREYERIRSLCITSKNKVDLNACHKYIMKHLAPSSISYFKNN
jgi:hypothetical protein